MKVSKLISGEEEEKYSRISEKRETRNQPLSSGKSVYPSFPVNFKCYVVTQRERKKEDKNVLQCTHKHTDTTSEKKERSSCII